MLTLNELKEKVAEQITEFDLVDLLGLTTWDLVNAFEDKLEAKYAQILDELILGEFEDE
jgi:hypothetical protein